MLLVQHDEIHQFLAQNRDKIENKLRGDYGPSFRLIDNNYFDFDKASKTTDNFFQKYVNSSSMSICDLEENYQNEIKIKIEL